MKVLHVLPSASSLWGGPPRAVRDLAAGLAALGVENSVVALGAGNHPLVDFPRNVKVRLCGDPLMATPSAGVTLAAKIAIPPSMELSRVIAAEVRSADVVHLHEVWHVPQVVGAAAALLLGRPYILSPHGELQPWAVGQHRYLKRFAWHAYQKRLLSHGSGIHVLTSRERKSVESLGIRAPIRVIPNGVDLETIDKNLREERNSLNTSLAQASFVLYVGRLAVGKGLETLVDAMGEIARYQSKVTLVLVGPDDEGLWSSLKHRCERMGIGEHVKYLGIIKEPAKYAIFASAQVFVLPSSSEGLSVSVLEALACGVPVVVTEGCNMSQEELAGAGLVTKQDPCSVAEAVLTVLQSEETQRAMALNARSLAAKRFSSKAIAAQMVQFYRDTIHRHTERSHGQD